MKYPFLASFLVFCVIFYLRNKKTDMQRERQRKEYFELEAKANNTRKQPLDNLNYINIPFDSLPTTICTDDSVIKECLSDLENLCNEDIVNFTGLTNTDLKLQYGPANLPYLQKCDLSFTHLVRVLNDWSAQLSKLGFNDDALTVLEFAISIKADVSNIYFLAADIYIEKNTPEKIDELISTASQLNSIIRDSIIRTLKNKTGRDN